MKIDEVTALILTFDEEANLRATLESLSWIPQILIVDSFSTDQTLAIASSFPQVRVVQRPFDHFAEQCNFGLSLIKTKWTLSIDCDYQCGALQHEIAELKEDCAGYRCHFVYSIFGQHLRGALYPPRVVLFQTQLGTYERDGHGHRLKIEGEIRDLKRRVVHDDRKSLQRWVSAQYKYASLEADKLSQSSHKMDWKDRLRKWPLLAAGLSFLYCLFGKMLFLNGRAGLYYAMQRAFAEFLLSLEQLDRKLRK